MVGDARTYLLAVRRGLRDVAPADWQDRIRELPGVTAGPTASLARMQVEADSQALTRIRIEFGALLRIEQIALRRPSS